MANRYIDTGFFKSPYVRGLKGQLKTLYCFIICDSSGAGIWIKDLHAAKLYTGFKITETDFKTFLSDGKAVDLGNGKFFFPDFIEHQYPKGLSRANPAHTKIIEELQKYELLDGTLKVLRSPSEGTNVYVKVTVKEEVKEEVKVEVKVDDESQQIFQAEVLHPLQKHIRENFTEVSRLETQLSYEESRKLVEDFERSTIQRVLEAMENYKGLTKKYKSVYLTINNWCKRNSNGTGQTTSKRKQPFTGNNPSDIMHAVREFTSEGKAANS